MKVWTVRALALALAGCALPVAGYAHGGSHHHDPSHQEEHECSTCEYSDAMEKMHHDMMIAYTGDTDLDFARGMIPHHQGAVDMAKVELKYGKDKTLRYLAGWIVQGQTVEIGQMKTWLRGRLNSGAPVVDAPETAEFRQAMEKMHHNMMIDYTGDADVDFARGMIPHHQGAIDMAVVELRSGKNQEMHKLSSDIVNSQSQEIAVLQRWLDAHPAAPAPDRKHSHEHTDKHAGAHPAR